MFLGLGENSRRFYETREGNESHVQREVDGIR